MEHYHVERLGKGNDSNNHYQCEFGTTKCDCDNGLEKFDKETNTEKPKIVCDKCIFEAQTRTELRFTNKMSIHLYI